MKPAGTPLLQLLFPTKILSLRLVNTPVDFLLPTNEIPSLLLYLVPTINEIPSLLQFLVPMIEEIPSLLHSLRTTNKIPLLIQFLMRTTNEIPSLL